MSLPLIRRSRDLRRLADEGYDIDVVAGHLVLRDVPYVDHLRRVRRGVLVSTLDLAGDRTVAPGDHYAWFAGALPCDHDGRPLLGMVHAHHARSLAADLKVDHWLCSKPFGREFVDYYEKMTTFTDQISGYAAALDPTATARTGCVVAAEGIRSPFQYVDTATARNGTGALIDRLAGLSIGIVGLGGTGAYILDLICKTPVRRIHVFDDDAFLQHNAFRAPGAASREDLEAIRSKVDHFDRIYSKLHRGIVPHPVRIHASNLRLIERLDFVFLCMDDAAAKRAIVEALEKNNISFIDVGMGLQRGDAGLTGILRVATSTPAMRDHVRSRNAIPLSTGGNEDAYRSNIQIVELNALNAALAVIRWKRLYGYYADLEHEHLSTYSIDGNHILNECTSGMPRQPDAPAAL